MKTSKFTTFAREAIASLTIEFKSQPLSWIANIATVCGLGIAIYALVNPATVANYLEKISDATNSSATSLASIEADTPIIAEGSQRTANATETLAAALKLRPKFAAQFFKDSNPQLQLTLSNQTLQILRGLEIFAVYPTNKTSKLGPFVLPPTEDLLINIDGEMPTLLCYGYETDNPSKQFLIEIRTLTRLSGSVREAGGWDGSFANVATSQYRFVTSISNTLNKECRI